MEYTPVPAEVEAHSTGMVTLRTSYLVERVLVGQLHTQTIQSADCALVASAASVGWLTGDGG
eukprot:377656-Amphidinium_carterae.2